jgi:S-methylmethionine-dependent homocysteine/selenocysteine methylase
MTRYANLKSRLDNGDVLLLDGAVGTQLQSMGAPMDNTAWAAAALASHPSTVRRMHELYVEAGCDIITTNTYSSARHNLEPRGLGDSVAELNIRAVALAEDARDRKAGGRDIFIAGAISNFGLIVGGEPTQSLHRYARARQTITAEQAKANLAEQAETLASAGVDFLLVESTGSMEHRRWLYDACRATGLPVFVGFRCRRDGSDPTLRIGYSSQTSFAEGLDEIAAAGPDAIGIFHSLIEYTDPAIDIALANFTGPIVVYPEADRKDYTATFGNPLEETKFSPDEYAAIARGWTERGVQIIGGCCGIGLPYIRPLRAALPKKAGPRSSAGGSARGG